MEKFFEIRTVDRVTKLSDYFNFVTDCEVVTQGKFAFLKIVSCLYSDYTKTETRYIALDTIREYSVKEMRISNDIQR